MNQRTKKIFFTIGIFFSPLYAYVMKIRALFYRIGFLKIHYLPVPVISVGNLTMGGSGKTPLVIYLTALLKKNGFKPAVVSRGYRGTSNDKVNIVSDGKDVLMNAQSSGDEPFLIANTISGVVVVTGKKRIFPCRTAVSELGCTVIILDDGFQHLSVARNLDIVLFDTMFFAGNSRVFPGGDLRESVAALNRSDVFLLTGVDKNNHERSKKCSTLLKTRFPEIPVYTSHSIYNHVLKYKFKNGVFSKTKIGLDGIPEGLVCFCGIANPDRFQKALAEHALSFSEFIIFPDHHKYTESDIENLIDIVKDRGAPGLLTTEKDITKLANLSNLSSPVYTLPLLLQPDEEFVDFITAFIEKIKKDYPSSTC